MNDENISVTSSRNKESEAATSIRRDGAVEARIHPRRSEIFSVLDKTTARKQEEQGYLVKARLFPSYVGYTTREFAQLYRAAKDEPLTDEEN